MESNAVLESRAAQLAVIGTEATLSLLSARTAYLAKLDCDRQGTYGLEGFSDLETNAGP